MAVDLLGEVLGLKSAYERERGAQMPTGIKHATKPFPLITPGKGVPMTRWSDVTLVHHHLRKMADPTMEECTQEYVKKSQSWLSDCLLATGFARTAGYKAARAQWDKQNPYLRAAALAGSPGNLIVGAQYALQRLTQPYPFNEEFWGYAVDFAKERQAAGMVPHWSDIAIESVKHAVSELPSTLQSAAETAWDAAAAAGDLIPKLDTVAMIVKWGTIACALLAALVVVLISS